MKKILKKVLIGLGIIIAIFAIIIGYNVYKDLKQEEVLKQEVIKLTNKDLLKDNYNVDIKTTGDYAYVENAIKNFYKELSDNVKQLNYTLDNDKLLEILTPENLEKERPTFSNSHSLIEKTKQESTTSLQNISKLCDEQYIKELLDKDKVSNYYINFYEKIMYTEKDLKTLKEVKEQMEKTSADLNEFLDKVEEILKMLEKNNNYWYIENKQIYFQTEEQVNEYNKLYEELKKIANEKLGSDTYKKSFDKDINI